MAREKKPASGPVEPQQEELTVVVMKYRGGSGSLQKGFDAVTQAIASLGPAPSTNHRVIVQRPQAQLPAADEVIDAELQDMNDVGDDAPEPQEKAAPAAPKAKRTPGASKYTFNNEFNLAPDGLPSLKEYCAGKNPQTENDRFMVASAWIQTHGGMGEGFNGGHLFTCFRAMDWKTQADMTQPMRAMKRKKSYYENPTFGKWRLTGIGLGVAEKVGQNTE